MRNKNSIMKYIEPATVVTLFTAGMYLCGITYFNSYFGRFGIDHNSLDYPTLFYLVKGFYPLLICSTIVAFFLIIAKNKPNNFFDYLKGNLLAFAISTVLILQSYYSELIQNHSKLLVIITFLLGITLFISSIIATLTKRSLSTYLLKMSPLKRLLGICLLLLFCNTLTEFSGNHNSFNIIKCKSNRIKGINFILKDESKAFPQTKNKDFILIEHRKGKYFVVIKQKEFNPNPELFIISESEVSMAKIFFLSETEKNRSSN